MTLHLRPTDKDDFVTCRQSKNISHDAKLCECAFAASFGPDRLCRRDDLRAKYDDGSSIGDILGPKTVFEVGKEYTTRGGSKALLVFRLVDCIQPLVWVSPLGRESWTTAESGAKWPIRKMPNLFDVLPPEPALTFVVGKRYRVRSNPLRTVQVVYLSSTGLIGTIGCTDEIFTYHRPAQLEKE